MPYDLTTMQSIYHGQDEIVEITYNGSLVYQKSSGPDYTEPFYVENITNNVETLSIKKNSDDAPTLNIEYLDGTTWKPLCTTSATAYTQTFQPGDKLYLRCTADTWATTNRRNMISGVSKIGGNIMSLLYGSNFTGQETSFPANSTNNFRNTFRESTNLVDASKLLLPALTLTNNCYYRMFYKCNALNAAPALPATTLAPHCCDGMFESCTSLTTAPALPATTLTDSCYHYMFQGCTSLTTAPALPATTLTDYCYTYMFQGCTSLTTAPALPATTLAQYCYQYMFESCTSLTTAPALPATTLAQYCYQYMFQGCTALTTVPALSATTLGESCCDSMFMNCTALTTAPALPATTLTDYCYTYMFQGCTSLTTAPALPATTLAASCYAGMFSGCTSLTTAPSLSATTLAINCCTNMFSGCTSLNYVKCLIGNASTSYFNNWLGNVSSTGTFTKAAGATWPTGNSGIPSGWTVVEV